VAAEAPDDRQWVAIAVLIGPRGNRGEVEAIQLTSHPERFGRVSEVYLFDGGNLASELRCVEVEEAWEYRGRVVFKFRGVDTISEAECLRGREVRIPLASRLPLPPGEYYQSDLVGCEVIERATGARVGRVRKWQEAGGPALLEVEGVNGEEILVPFASAICVEIDVERRRILVDLPEGLKDLNR
jgi:16S rRNA processing protein RimM